MFTNDTMLYDQITERMKNLQREAEADRLAKAAQSEPHPAVFYRLAQTVAANLKRSGRQVDQQPQRQPHNTFALQNRG